MNNKYNSLKETFTSLPIFNALLSTMGTPPADITFVSGDFTPQILFAEITAGNVARVKFPINDHPRIIGVGLFCNMGDGLIHVTSPEVASEGINLSVDVHEFDALDADQGSIGEIRIFRIPELNQVFDADELIPVSGVDTTLDSLRIEVTVLSTDLVFSTVTVDPDLAAQPITFRPVVVIEHTFRATAP